MSKLPFALGFRYIYKNREYRMRLGIAPANKLQDIVKTSGNCEQAPISFRFYYICFAMRSAFTIFVPLIRRNSSVGRALHS